MQRALKILTKNPREKLTTCGCQHPGEEEVKNLMAFVNLVVSSFYVHYTVKDDNRYNTWV